MQFTDKWDAHFKASAAAWLPGVDWKLLKAQCYQESRLDPLAVSPAGAKGLCQFMGGTFNDVGRSLGWVSGASAFDPELSIDGASYYMSKLRYTWRRNRTSDERQPLAQASYNAGTGNILKAQALCANALLWAAISTCLPKVTGEKNTHETRTYVERIAKWFNIMRYQ